MLHLVVILVEYISGDIEIVGSYSKLPCVLSLHICILCSSLSLNEILNMTASYFCLNFVHRKVFLIRRMQKSLILVSHIRSFRQMLTDTPWLLWVNQGEIEWLASFFSYIVPWSRKLFFWKFCTRLLSLLVSFKSQEPRHVSALMFFEFLTGSLPVRPLHSSWGGRRQRTVDRNRTDISSPFCLALKGKKRL